MGTLQVNQHPSSRLAAGDHVIHAASSANVSPIKKKLDAFRKIHAAFVAAEKKVGAADAALEAAEAAVGEADAEQDAAVVALAAKMIGDGAPKANPLKLFGLDAPSRVVIMPVAAEAKVTASLAKKAVAWKDASAATKAAAATLAKASAKVSKALAALPAKQAAHKAAMSARDALGVPWARAFAHLKNAARTADDDGAPGLFATLFGVETKARKPRKANGQPTPPPPAAPSA